VSSRARRTARRLLASAFHVCGRLRPGAHTHARDNLQACRPISRRRSLPLGEGEVSVAAARTSARRPKRSSAPAWSAHLLSDRSARLGSRAIRTPGLLIGRRFALHCQYAGWGTQKWTQPSAAGLVWLCPQSSVLVSCPLATSARTRARGRPRGGRANGWCRRRELGRLGGRRAGRSRCSRAECRPRLGRQARR
jgi:hypothetical protein